MAHKQQLFDALKPRLEKFHAASSPNNMEEVRLLFSDFAGKALPSETFMSLLAAGHDMEAVTRAEGDQKGISLDQVCKLFVLGVQATDTEDALGKILDMHIAKLESSSSTPAASATVEAGSASRDMDPAKVGAQI
jgi:hypothetical protein